VAVVVRVAVVSDVVVAAVVVVPAPREAVVRWLAHPTALSENVSAAEHRNILLSTLISIPLGGLPTDL
jgi:hypothetical protein